VGRVIANASVSLDGFIAKPNDDPGPLFDWYENGDVPFTKDASLSAGDLLGQTLEAGLVDETPSISSRWCSGPASGFFGSFAAPIVMLENPEVEVVEGDRVTHLRYRLR